MYSQVQFHKEELDNLISDNLNNMTFHEIPCMIMHVKNACVLVYGRFAVSYQHD